ncbi:butyrate kinase [Sedimentibacter sp. zth1]|uniref:butyrate kinase n=1 Tax=Sedimentibacter sp. zth1 TaxID=2816908 RepID=UPI001A9112E7|nr:butyrate kinase [Sedimentibacter sp. zth1]QSX07277.1 butyrate kinase [Sedimentibacter sp. zth1]
MMYKILSINPGSTSTKIAIYEDEHELFVESILHTDEELSKFHRVQDQFEFRKSAVLNFLKQNKFDVGELSAIVGRGGLLPPVKSGAYKVNELMVDRLMNRPILEHASNLAALIAYELSNELHINAYIYDSIAVDELMDIAKHTGLYEVDRVSLTHALNMRAAAMKVSKKLDKKYVDCNFVVAHLGGGISLSAHHQGKMIDIVSDDEGPFSPERSGRVAVKDLFKYVTSGKYTKDELKKKLRGNAGLKGHLETVDAREVEKRIHDGDEKAKLIYETMAYQIAKSIGELSVTLYGNVDRIILTGGIAYSKMLTDLVIKRVNFIAPVEVIPGENEMESLTLGALRVLRGEEKARDYFE